MATIVSVRGKEGVRYRVQVRLKGSRTESAYFKRKTDAKKWAGQIEAAIREGRYFPSREAAKHTVADLIDRYLQEVSSRKPRSMESREQHLRWWRERLGHLRLRDVTPAAIVEQRDALLHGITRRGIERGPGTVNRYLGSLSHAFTIAVREWEWCDQNPCRRVARAQEPRGRVRFLSSEERERLLQASRESPNRLLYPLVLLAVSTGARRGELLGLRWNAVDFEHRVIRLEHTKNGDRRALPIVGPALDALRELGQVRRIDSDLVFPSRRGAEPAGIQKAWNKAVEQAKLKDFRFHDLRHTAASYLAMSGATPAEIAEVLGHRTLAMVRRYAHLSAEHVVGVVERMNAQFLA
jgi:integrase